jgi:hypothetical protein
MSTAYIAVIQEAITRLIDLTGVIPDQNRDGPGNGEDEQGLLLPASKWDKKSQIRAVRTIGLVRSRFPKTPEFLVKRIAATVEVRRTRLREMRRFATLPLSHDIPRQLEPASSSDALLEALKKMDTAPRPLEAGIAPTRIQTKHTQQPDLYIFPRPPTVPNPGYRPHCDWCPSVLNAEDLEISAWRYVAGCSANPWLNEAADKS